MSTATLIVSPIATTSARPFGALCVYATTERLRSATEAERDASIEAARHDGGAGVIEVDGVSCYVE